MIRIEPTQIFPDITYVPLIELSHRSCRQRWRELICIIRGHHWDVYHSMTMNEPENIRQPMEEGNHCKRCDLWVLDLSGTDLVRALQLDGDEEQE